MIRSRCRALFVMACLLLVAPSIAVVGMDQARAQDATPVATDAPAPPPLVDAMPADTAAYLATEFDLTNDQYLELSALVARLVVPGAGDTISSIVAEITKLLAKIPSDLSTVLKDRRWRFRFRRTGWWRDAKLAGRRHRRVDPGLCDRAAPDRSWKSARPC